METAIDLESVFTSVKTELVRLLQERDDTLRRRAEIDQQLAGLKQTITGLVHYARGQRDSRIASVSSSAFKALLERVDDASPALTLTEACRRAFKTSQKPLSPENLRDYLSEAGYSFEAYRSNPLISIHSVLKRLQDSEEIELAKTEGATKFYAPKKSRNNSLTNVLDAIAKMDLDLSQVGGWSAATAASGYVSNSITEALAQNLLLEAKENKGK